MMIKKRTINTITRGDNIQLSKKDFESIFTVLDELDEKNLQLIEENEQLKKEKDGLFLFFMDYYDQLEDELIEIEIKLEERIKELEKENEQLKQKNDNLTLLSARIQAQNDELKERNNRQAKTIHNLYSLMENKDWEGLTAIVEEMEEAEELNRLEFEAYCGDKDD